MGTDGFPGKMHVLQPPEATLVELKATGEPESNVESAVSAVDKCCKELDLNSNRSTADILYR